MIRSLLWLALAAGLPTAHAAQTFGAEMPDGDPLPLAAALDDPARFGEPARKFEGRVVQVCQNKGCWMMLEQDGRAARVMMHDHSFSVPKDAAGRAVVHGVLSEKTLSEEAAAHLAEDAGESKPVAQVEYRITAYSVQLDDA
jgi:hypothetical protein